MYKTFKGFVSNDGVHVFCNQDAGSGASHPLVQFLNEHPDFTMVQTTLLHGRNSICQRVQILVHERNSEPSSPSDQRTVRYDYESKSTILNGADIAKYAVSVVRSGFFVLLTAQYSLFRAKSVAESLRSHYPDCVVTINNVRTGESIEY